MPDTPVTPYNRLRMQILVVSLLFGLVPLIAMGIAGLKANRDVIETQRRNALEAVVKSRKVTIDMFLEEKMRQLQFAAFSHSVEQLSKPELLESFRDEMQRDHGAIVDLGLIADNGRHIAYAGPYKLQKADYSRQPWFQRVMAQGAYESDVFMGLRHFPHMVMAVKKREDGRDWILRATIDTNILSALLLEGGLESSAEVFILNRAGEYQTSGSDEHRLMEKADIQPLPLHSGVRVSEVERYGRREFLATGWLQGETWVLVARRPAPDLPVLARGHPAIIGLLVAGLVTIPILSYVIARHRLIRFTALERERATLYESIAQSQKLAAIGRLAAGVAHEINNPLAIIQAQAGVLADLLKENPDFPRSAEFRDRVGKVEAQVERARKVTHRLLGFSRREGSELEPVDIVAAMEETVGFLEKDLEVSHIQIIRDYGADIPIVRSSLAQMQQVFLNLINNALDAIGKDGEVQLSARRSDGGVLVKVADTGPGISEIDLPKVFEPFFSTKSGDGRHTGMGLAICQEIMRNLDGRIGAESTVGKGTVFSLWFPPEVRA